MLKRLPRRFGLRKMMIAVAVAAVLMVYVGNYLRLRHRSYAEKEIHGLIGMIYISADELGPEAMKKHYRRCMIYMPLNWVDRTLFGGEGHVVCVMWSLAE